MELMENVAEAQGRITGSANTWAISLSREHLKTNEQGEYRDFFLMEPLDDGSDPLANTDAHGCQAVAALPPLHLVDQRRHDPRPATAEGVAKRDGAAVDVEFLLINPELSRAGEHLRGEGLV